MSKIFNIELNHSLNTALIVEPRFDVSLIYLINDTYLTLNPHFRNSKVDFNLVFYCGKNLGHLWRNFLHRDIIIRELPISNFTLQSYNDYFKSLELWESLAGDFVLSFQMDTIIINQAPLNIDYFMSMNKSFIGGNMMYRWTELEREGLNVNFQNFNGGLSLRKRKDMIRVIKEFGTKPTIENSPELASDREDVYFVIGCYKLGLPVGDTRECGFFCVHTILCDAFFGVHQAPLVYKDIMVGIHPKCANNPKIFDTKYHL